MGRDRGGPPGGAVDLGARQTDEGPPPVAAQFVNDVQPTIEGPGVITLTFAYQGRGGTGDAIAVTLPSLLLLELASLTPELLAASLTMHEKQADRIREQLEKRGNAVAARGEQTRRGGPPVPLDDRRG